jgi:hypothetical protein
MLFIEVDSHVDIGVSECFKAILAESNFAKKNEPKQADQADWRCLLF